MAVDDDLPAPQYLNIWPNVDGSTFWRMRFLWSEDSDPEALAPFLIVPLGSLTDDGNILLG